MLANIGGGRGKDIVLATSDGLMRVYSGSTGHMLPGWPQAMAPVEGSGATAAAIGPVRAGFLATPAVGDLDGSGRPDIVEAGLDGRVYAWDARGHPCPASRFASACTRRPRTATSTPPSTPAQPWPI